MKIINYIILTIYFCCITLLWLSNLHIEIKNILSNNLVKMKKCDSPGCKFPRVFFNRAFGHKVCLSWRMTYHSHLDFSRIPETKQVKEAIATNSLWLNAILTHTNTYPTEDLYKGLKEELRDFIIKNEEFRSRLDEAEENDNDGELTKIEEEAFELKRQIDSSEMMRNFTFHRFQINKP